LATSAGCNAHQSFPAKKKKVQSLIFNSNCPDPEENEEEIVNVFGREKVSFEEDNTL